MIQRKFTKQWLYLKKYGIPSVEYAKILELSPSNIFQLNFWCDIIFYTKSKHEDIPNEVVFYLHDKAYEQIISNNLSESVKESILYKIQLLQYILGMSLKDQFSKLRQGLQECLMIAESYLKIKNPRAYSKQLEEKHKIQIVSQHLQKKNVFTIQFLSQMLSQYIIRESTLLGSVENLKNISQLYDISVTNILINHITGTFLKSGNLYIDTKKQVQTNKRTRQFIRGILTGYQKQKIVYSMRDYLLRRNKPVFIQFLMNVAYHFKIENQIFRYQNIFTSNSVTNNQTDSQIMYGIFQQELLGNGCKFMPFFQKFMVENLAGKPIALHNIIFTSQTKNRPNSSMRNMIESQDMIIFQKIKKSPLKMSNQCLSIYLQKSNFRNPYTNNLLSIKSTNPKHRPKPFINNQSCQPFLFLPILKQFWNHAYHKQILNYCLWISLDHWFYFIKTLMIQNLRVYEISEANSQICQYQKNMGLALFQFMAEFQIGTFIKYYPSETNLVVDIMHLPSFSELVLKNTDILSLNWLSLALSSQFVVIIKQKGGLNLAYQLLQKRNSLQIQIAEYLLSMIENQFQKGIDKIEIKRCEWLKKLLTEFEKGWKYKERAVYLIKTYIQSQNDDLI